MSGTGPGTGKKSGGKYAVTFTFLSGLASGLDCVQLVISQCVQLLISQCVQLVSKPSDLVAKSAKACGSELRDWGFESSRGRILAPTIYVCEDIVCLMSKYGCLNQ